jgi:bacillithiol biosynthesis deacetylase BshB1
MNVDILAVGVHPDDIELSCSGTLLKHIALGKTVGLCDLTRGELGTRGSAKLRLEEAEKARKMMGAAFRVNLGMEDGFFTHSRENLISVIRIIRLSKPQIVLANAIDDRHPDHGRAAKLVAEACFLSGLSKIETYDDAGQRQDAWRPKNVFHYVQDRNIHADFIVDISAFIEQKMALIHCFSSQFFNQNSTEPETPISIPGFLEFIKAKNKAYGRDIPCDYAEAFTTNKLPGIKNLFDLE